MLKRLSSSSFLKNSSILALGTGLAFAISFLFQPLLTRIYSPEEFGLFSVYTSVFGILVSISSFRYDTAIIVTKTKEEGFNLTFVSIFISLVFSILLYPIFFFFDTDIVKLVGVNPENTLWLYLIPLSIFLFSSYRAVNTLLTRNKKFKASSINKIVRRSSEGIMQLLFGKLSIFNGLIYGGIIGDLLNNISGFVQLKIKKRSIELISISKLKEVMIRYKSYPIMGTIPYLLNTISLLIPVLIFNNLFNQDDTGQLGLSINVLSIPISLISMSFSQVLSQDLAKKKNKNSPILKFIFKVSLGLFALAIIGVVVIYFFSEPIFTFVFGEEWKIASQISSILVFAIGIRFIVSPLSVLFTSIEKVKQGGWWQIFHFFLILILFAFDYNDIFDFVQVYVVLELIAYGIYYLQIIYQANKYEKDILLNS